MVWAIMGLAAGSASATPYELSYGGRLTEASGKPVSGPVALRVTFFRSLSGNDQIAVTFPDLAGVTLQDGIFQIPINLAAADFHTIFNGTDQVFIQIEDLTHGLTYPRQKFSAVPYALKVPVDGESITYNPNGQLSLGNGAHRLKLPNGAGALNKILKSDGNGALVWGDDLNGGGVGSIGTGEILDGSITNDDISNTAAISVSKISGLGSLATKSTIGSADITDGAVTGADLADGTITDADIHATAGISYLKISGLGSAASKNVGTGAGDVAAGAHTHTAGEVSGLGSLATKSAVASSDISDGTVSGTDIASGTITDANISASAAIAGTKISPNFGAQNVTTTGDLSSANVIASNYAQLSTVSGAPPAADCDAAAEYGRMKVDPQNGSPALYVCTVAGWTMFGVDNQHPTSVFTRATIAYNASDASKDALCATEFGSAYVAADAKEVVVVELYPSGDFNVGNDAGISYAFAVGSAYVYKTNAASNGSKSLACVYKYATHRFTRATIAYNASNASKDALCATEFGSAYVAADVKEMPGVKVYGPSSMRFNVANDTACSYKVMAGANLMYNTNDCGSPGSYSLACIRK